MSYYRLHMFFCTNQRQNSKKCCQDAAAEQACHYAKQRVRELGIRGKGQVRVSSSGCMGRCASGPIVAIYPEGVWYTYHSLDDIEEIIQCHVLQGSIVERLRLADDIVTG